MSPPDHANRDREHQLEILPGFHLPRHHLPRWRLLLFSRDSQYSVGRSRPVFGDDVAVTLAYANWKGVAAEAEDKTSIELVEHART